MGKKKASFEPGGIIHHGGYRHGKIMGKIAVALAFIADKLMRGMKKNRKAINKNSKKMDDLICGFVHQEIWKSQQETMDQINTLRIVFQKQWEDVKSSTDRIIAMVEHEKQMADGLDDVMEHKYAKLQLPGQAFRTVRYMTKEKALNQNEVLLDHGNNYRWVPIEIFEMMVPDSPEVILFSKDETDG